MKKKLTVRGINALKPANPGKREVLWDSEVPNFGIRVTDAGKISFIVMRRVDGSSCGAWSLSTAAARNTPKACSPRRAMTRVKRCATWRRASTRRRRPRSNGPPPLLRKRPPSTIRPSGRPIRLRRVAEDFIKRHVLAADKGRPKLKSGAEVAATIRREIIPKWKGRLITDIARRDVVKLLEAVVDDGRASVAHHLLAYLSKLLQLGDRPRHLRAAVRRRSRAAWRRTSSAQRSRASASWATRRWSRYGGPALALPSPFGAFVRLLLVTGQRLREVANAKWSEIDLDAKLWMIPAARMKGDAAHEVPLSPLAVEILGALAKPECRKPEAFVFSTTGGKAPISGFSKAKIALDRLINEARANADLGAKPIGPFVFHDLRRTMRTALSGLPVPDLVAELVIAHAKPGLHKVYDQHAYRDEKRRALDLWAAKLLVDRRAGRERQRRSAEGGGVKPSDDIPPWRARQAELRRMAANTPRRLMRPAIPPSDLRASDSAPTLARDSLTAVDGATPSAPRPSDGSSKLTSPRPRNPLAWQRRMTDCAEVSLTSYGKR